jgi:hypothetical protein
MDNPGAPGGQALEIGEAAQRLGLSVEALRKRLQRGRATGRKGPDGRWLVVLDGTAPARRPGPGPGHPAEGLAPVAAELHAIRLELESLNRRLADLAGLIALLAPPRRGSSAGREDRLKPMLMEVLKYLERQHPG